MVLNGSAIPLGYGPREQKHYPCSSGSPSKSNGSNALASSNNSSSQVLSNSCVKRRKIENGESSRGAHFSTVSILEQRKALPAYGVKNRLISEIQKYPTVIIIGETGSGKTTQIPQFMYEARLNRDGMIGVTQPRRVAAITLSQRVALEMNTSHGHLVGYTVRFEDVTSDRTKLKYLTDGMLLREAMTDSMLMSYGVIILDEAHERTVHTDVLFGIVKKAQMLRGVHQKKPLKIVVMSATMDVDHFSEYFGKAPVLYLEGRQYPVQVYHAVQPQEDYVFSCLVTIFQIHQEAPANQDILVFLTGQEEIEAMASNIRLIAKDLEGKSPALKVYPLYSSLPSYQQLDVFRPTPEGMRKVILSTNIAETSVTISGIVYVIDSGMVKTRNHRPGTGLEVLKVQRISQAQALQRTGRAGREASGFCYRTYTKKEFDLMQRNTTPEIQRCNLASVVLQLLALGINATTFDFMDKPPHESVAIAFQQLKQLGAIDNVESATLTKLGRQMSRFPLDPHYSKILLSAKDYGCVDEVLSIIAILSGESVFVTPLSKREQAAAAREKFISSAGDHLTLLNVFRMFNKVNQKKQWCQDNFLSWRNLSYASEVRTQLAELCRHYGVVPSSCGQNLDQVRRCLLSGLFMNVAELQREKQYITVDSRQVVAIHPSSVLHGSLPQCVLFTKVVQTGRCYIQQLSVIEQEWLVEFLSQIRDKT